MHLLLCLMLVTQDNEVSRLITQLSDDSIDIRETALLRLVQIGEPALKELTVATTSSDTETRMRAQLAIQSIVRNARIKKVATPARTITLKHSGTIETLFAEITRQTGLTISCDYPRTTQIDIEYVNTPILLALDLLCTKLGNADYDLVAGNLMLYRSERIAKPSFYSDGFRVRIESVEVLRTSDFKDGTAGVAIGFATIYEPNLKITCGPTYEIVSMVGDDDKQLITAYDGNSVILRKLGCGVNDNNGQVSYAIGLNVHSKTIKSVKGRVKYRFAIATIKSTFDVIEAGTTFTQDGVVISINERSNGSMVIRARKDGNILPMRDHYVADSLIVTDCDGRQYTPNYSRGDDFTIWLSREERLKPVIRVELTTISEFYDKFIDFELTDVKLP